MKISLKTGLKIVITSLLVWWLVGGVDWKGVMEILSQVSLSLLGLYGVLQLTGNFLSAAKWQYLARSQGFTFRIIDGFFGYLAGAFINNFLPSTIGGDTYRTMWMSESGKRFEAFTVVFFDRLSGLLGLFLVTAVGFLFLPWKLFLTDPVLIIIFGVVLGVTLIILISLFWFTGLFELLLLIIDWFPPLSKVKGAIERFRPLIETDRYLMALLWTLVFLVVGIGFSNYALWSALGADISLLTFFGCIFLATLIANIPISINNIGIKEWSYVLVFGLVGISPELAVTAALLSRFLQMLLSLLALPWYLRERKQKTEVSISPL